MLFGIERPPPRRMPIPRFNRQGNIPVGDLFGKGKATPLIHTSLAGLHERFVQQVPTSRRRPLIWNGWMRHRAALAETGLEFATLVNGSFTSAISEPADIDLCIMVNAHEINALSVSDPPSLERFEALVDARNTKPIYQCDAHVLHVYPVGHPRFSKTAWGWNVWTRVFGADRRGNAKAFLLVTEGGGDMNEIDPIIESCDREIAELRWTIEEHERLDERLGGPDAASKSGLRSLRNRLEDVERERDEALAELK